MKISMTVNVEGYKPVTIELDLVEENKRGPYATKKQQEERNLRICDLYRRGESISQIAFLENLSAEYIRRILHKMEVI